MTVPGVVETPMAQAMGKVAGQAVIGTELQVAVATPKVNVEEV